MGTYSFCTGRWLVSIMASALLVCSCCKVIPDSPDQGSHNIGPAGGQTTQAGVTVNIPPGALARKVAISIAVKGTTISLKPDIEFALPVRVVLDPSVWNPDVPGFVVSDVLGDGDMYRIAEIESDGVSAYYDTLHFSDHHLESYATIGCYAENASSWPDNTVWPVKREHWVSGYRDSTALEQIRANGACLVDVSSFFTCFGSVSHASTQTCVTNADCAAYPPWRVAGTCSGGLCTYSQRSKTETHMMSPEAAAALKVAEQRLQDMYGPSYQICINGAYDSSGAMHTKEDYHYFGAAVDLAVCKGSPCVRLTGSALNTKLDELGPILAASGFTWVKIENDLHHDHASIPSPSCGVSAYGQKACGPPVQYPDAGASCYYCYCNDTQYSTFDSCFASCKVSLACFSGNCVPCPDAG